MLKKESRQRLKVAVLETGLDKEVRKARLKSFRQNDNSLLEALKDIHGEIPVKVADSLNNARIKRKQRVTERVATLAQYGYLLFVTLTFTDDTLKKTSELTRRRYVSRYLKSQSPLYVANIDYGGKNGREHYHALVLAEKIDFKPWHSLGAIQLEKVKASPDDSEKVAKYVSKLSNHAMKVNNGIAPRLIYSHERKAMKDFFKFDY